MSHSENTFDTIFDHARRLGDVQKREDYLNRVCAHDPELHAEIESLLAAHTKADGFMMTQGHPGQETMTVAPFEGAGTAIGPYKLLEKIGEGGFGIVYMAEQKEPIRRRVALKIIKLGMDTEQVVARFEAERQALAMMDHPNIAKVIDGGATESGRPYFVMELVRGTPITTFCDANNLSTEERLDLFISVCHAIQHAHQKGIIHRDIKPSNVLIAMHDDQPVVRVIDFGIAKATQQNLTEKTLFTRFQQFLGTPTYMSPEQAGQSSLDIDTRSDIYSLGVLLYEILTGQPPLDPKALTTGDYDEMRRRIQEVEAPKPSSRVSLMSEADSTTIARQRKSDPVRLKRLLKGDLDWIVLKALEKDRRRRYDTANDFAEDIRRFLTDRPVRAAAPSTVYVLRKYARRHRTALAVIAAFILLLVVGTTVSMTQAIRANRGETRANRLYTEAETLRLEERSAKELAQRLTHRAQRYTYIANMNLVQAAFEQDNYLSARRLLDETSRYPDRGFEWYYWQREMHPEVLAFRGHTTPVSEVAFSPDGRWVLSCETPDESFSVVKMWDRATGAERYTFKTEGRIDRLAFSPDGSQFLINNRDARWRKGLHSKLLIYSVETGEALAACPDLRDGSYSPDGRQIACVTDDAVILVDASGKRPPSPFVDLKGYERPIVEARPSDIEPLLVEPSFRWCRFSPDGQSLMTGIGLVRIGPSSTDQIIVWDTVTGKQKGKAFLNDSWARQSRVVSPDSRQLATTSWNNLTIKRVATGEVVGNFESRGDLRSLAYSPDGKYLFAGSRDLTARVIEVASQQEVRRLPGHTLPIAAVAWSPDGRWLATGDEECVARVWDSVAMPKSLSLHGGDGAALSPDGSRIVLAMKEEDGWKLVLLRASTGEPIRTIAPKTLTTLKNVRGGQMSFSADGRQVVAAIWHAPTAGAKTDEPAGRLIVRWNLATDELLEFPFPNRDSLQSARFSPDGHHMILTGGNSATIWNAGTGELERTLDHGTADVQDAIYSPDGTRIFTAARLPNESAGRQEDAGVRIWDAASGRELARWPAEVQNQSLACLSPDGRRFAVPVQGNQVKVFDFSTNREALTLSGHQQRIRSVTFSPDGRRLLTASGDQTAKLWDAETGRELLTLKGHSRTVNSVAFFPDGRRIFTTSGGDTIRIWEAATDAEAEAWQRAEEAHADLIRVQSARRTR